MTVLKKKIRRICILGIFGILLSACAKSQGAAVRLETTNAVANAIDAQIARESDLTKNRESEKAEPAKASEESFAADPEASSETSAITSTEGIPETLDPVEQAMADIESSQAEQRREEREKADALMRSTEGVDYDLTKMSSDLVYASVYQMMSEPEEFEGKVIRMKGTYFSSFFDQTQKQYHYCIIQDALACCSQGIEFVWGDGSHVYPEEYPENESTVEVTGTFELYQEEGDERLYCRLKDCTMDVVSGQTSAAIN